jgi:nicotinate-nucleotide adenylyltransferase
VSAAARAAGAPLGVLGGSFDPVHHGHLRSALEVLESCGLAEVLLIPSGRPPHRAPPVAGADLRLELLRAATAAEPRLVVDDREMRREGPSYTVDTLRALRAEHGARPLCLVVGGDAFLGLESWHRWRELFDLAHLIVMHRPGWELQARGALAEALRERRSDDPQALRRHSAGAIRVQSVTPLQISSSAVRALVAAGGDPRYLVPDAVRELILETGCYRETAAGRTAGT